MNSRNCVPQCVPQRRTPRALALGVRRIEIIGLAVYSIWAGHEDLGVLNCFNKKGRQIIASRYGNLNQDTLILTVSTVIRFAVLVVTLFDLYHERRVQMKWSSRADDRMPG